MADKTYKMLVTLSNGSTIDAGTFVAPQGPKGDAGTIPEALPQEASALKSGSLSTSGWEKQGYKTFWAGNALGGKNGFTKAGNSKELADILYSDDGAYAVCSFYMDGERRENIGFTYIEKDFSSPQGIAYRWGSSWYGEATVVVAINGDIYVKGHADRQVQYVKIGTNTVQNNFYTISDTSITANSDILMELTDYGGVKSYSMEAGKITVIRDAVPTQTIPYTYKVKQTNASGQFTLVNHYVPTVPNTIVESVNGQTGAVTIAVPTKTSELENDSGYVRSVIPPIVRNVVCNDVDSATTLDTTIACEVGDLILAQIIVRSALTLPTGWSLLRTIPAVETTYNQTLSFAYKRATSTSETLTVTQATAGRIYTNLVRLSNATSISYIQSCEKTNTGAVSISSTKPVTPNMVIWGASSATWNASSPYGDWTYSPSTLDYYSLSQATKAPRLGTFIDSSGAGERTFTGALSNGSGNGIMCGAVEIVGDEVARKGDIPTVGEWVAVEGTTAKLTEAGTYQVWRDIGGQILVYWDGQTESSCTLPFVSFLVNDHLPYFHYYGASITAGGVLSMTHYSMTTDGTTNWTQSAVETESGFKYRKIN